ncbi:hypothetical protein BpHYR1_016556, partial [Brachionus plicatilis]
LVTEWSNDRDPNFTTTKKFINKPEISVRQLTKAFEWCKLSKRIVKLSHNDELIFMFTSTNVSYQATKTTCKGYFEKTEWFSFDDYIKEINSIRFVKYNVIGVAYRLKLCEFPGLDLNLEANKKRGRRKQATPALVQRISTGPINPALQNSLSNENDNDQDQAESINNDIQTIVQPTTSSNLAPRKRGRPRKNP